MGRYEGIGRNAGLDPVLERGGEIGARIGWLGRGTELPECVESGTAETVLHAGNHEQSQHLIGLVGPNGSPHSVEVLDCALGRQRGIRPAVPENQLSSTGGESKQKNNLCS